MATSVLELARARGVAFPLRTERLTITPYAPDDAAVLFPYRDLDEVRTWMGRSYADVAELGAAFGASRETFVLRAGDVVVGDVKVVVEDAWAHPQVADRARNTQAELGWTLDPAHQGRGYATEAVRELMRLCFEDLGLRRIEAHCFADNEASWRLMERVGMRREGLFRADSLHATRGWIDGMSYGLLADEWDGRA